LPSIVDLYGTYLAVGLILGFLAAVFVWMDANNNADENAPLLALSEITSKKEDDIGEIKQAMTKHVRGLDDRDTQCMDRSSPKTPRLHRESAYKRW